MKKQTAKFFCENCNSEVPENARFCKKCGKFFISVRCPKCGATGSSSKFSRGCPHCGYAVNTTGKSTDAVPKDKKNQRLSYSEKKMIRSAFAVYENGSKKVSADSSLPIWVYVITTAVLVIVVAAVYSCIRGSVY